MRAVPFEATLTTPVIRILDEARARAFYVDWLGFRVDWEHRFEDGMPLYAQVSRDGIVLHLSEHRGDGTPGIHVYVYGRGVAGLHAEVAAKPNAPQQPVLDEGASGRIGMTLTDPFGNQLRIEENEPHGS